MFDIVVPKLNNNDATYVLVEWCYDDGETVPPDATVAVVETSKAAEDLVATEGGVLHRARAVNTECAFGDVIGRLFGSAEDRDRYLSGSNGHGSAKFNGNDPHCALRNGAAPAAPPVADIVVTEPAQELVRKFGVRPEQLQSLGRRVIRRADVELLVLSNQQPAGEVYPLSRRQRAVAEVVTRSHNTVPTAFTVLRVHATEALAARRWLSARTGQVIGIPELVIKAMAGLREKYPLFFGSLREDNTVHVPDGAHVGVTVDVGKGLCVPVVADADRRSVTEIAEVLRGFHATALRDAFEESALAGANIALSVNNYSDVVLVRPIVFPGHSCMLSVAGLQQSFVLTHKGHKVEPRQYFDLGIAYDHRVINGRDAVLFGKDIKMVLESADRLAELLS